MRGNGGALPGGPIPLRLGTLWPTPLRPTPLRLGTLWLATL